MKCKKCGSLNLKIIKSGPHNKLVCKDCLAFQKFVNNKDKNTFESVKEKNIIKGNENIFNKFIELSFMVRDAAGIVQNDMKITKDTKHAIEQDINQFKQTMNIIKLDLNDLEKRVLNHISTEIPKNIEPKNEDEDDKYSKLIKDLLINTKELNR